MEKIEFKSKDDWTLDEHRKYLWIHNKLPIQAMLFSNDQDQFVRCIWVKIHHEGEFVSNYFVYSQDEEQVHPLDYAIAIVEEFKKIDKSLKAFD